MAVGSGGLVLRSTNGGDTWSSPITGITASAKASTFPTCKTAERSVTSTPSASPATTACGSSAPARRSCARSRRSRPTWVRRAHPAAGSTPTATRKGTGTPDDDTCKLNSSYGEGFADAFFASPDVGYIVAASFSEVFFTTNNLGLGRATEARGRRQRRRRQPRDRGRPENPNRMWSVNADAVRPLDDRVHARRLADRRLVARSATTPCATSRTPARPTSTTPAAPSSPRATPGLVLNSIDGVNFYLQRRPTGRSRRSAGTRSASPAAIDGAIGGDNGKLAITTTANAIPDLTKPTGTIAGPDTATAGVPVTFSAAVADNAGGSGIDPAGVRLERDRHRRRRRARASR